MTETITFVAEQSTNLDTTCYRGSAPLAHLALVSQADVFDQLANPEGLQRDLSRKHAAEAYEYAARPNRVREQGGEIDMPRAFPEVVLNVRDKSVVKIDTLKLPGSDQLDITLARITFDVEKIQRAKTVKVSRVDGNHRLYYANGDGNGREPLLIPAPFQLHVGLTREQEGSLFLDINASQKGLNTSHLSVLRSRLTPAEQELIEHPHRAFALRLVEDSLSPFQGLVFLGGSRQGLREAGDKRPISFAALEGGLRRTLAKSQYLPELTEPDAKYQMIRRYWRAVQQTWPEAWAKQGEYVTLQNIGITSLSLLGASVIDRSMAAGHVEEDDLQRQLEPTKEVFDWHRETSAARGGVSGMSGNRAALEISGRMAQKLPKPVR